MAICHSFLASVEARYFCFQDFFEPEKRHHLTKQKYVSQISNWKNQDSCRFKSIIYPISSDYISCLFNLVRDESESESHSAVSDSVICDPMDYADPTGQNIGVGSHSLLQGIFPTQGLNPGLLNCRWILHRLSHQGSPFVTLSCDKSYLNVVSHSILFSCTHPSCEMLKCLHDEMK